METYGCAANQGDSSIIKGLLNEKGYTICDDIKEADYILINTCIVVDTTQQRMLHRLRAFKKEQKPVIVVGCMASVFPHVIKAVLPEASFITPAHIHHVLDVIEGNTNDFCLKEKVHVPRTIETKVNFPISDGCIYNCSYCITKKARGNLISYSSKGIVDDIKLAVKNGCKEVRLTSQDTASYGRSTHESLPSLISKICSIKGEFRIRVGMMHPLSACTIFDELMDSYDDKKVYAFLHLPLQSASDDILRRMRRGYLAEDFLLLVKQFRKRYPEGVFATDVIVAFPGEKEEDFQLTCNFIREIQPEIVNITRFSPRPFTDAKKMMNRIHTQLAKERSRKMAALTAEISLKRNKRCIGQRYNVFITNKQREWVAGKTKNYQSVFLTSGDIGDTINVKIIDAKTTHLFGVQY
jgi:MiaB-like tRNA modifying enzyme